MAHPAARAARRSSQESADTYKPKVAPRNVKLATANSSNSYAEGVQGMSKYDPKTGEVLEQVTLEPGSCDPHGLGFYKGAFIGCDAGHHPGWPDKDGPGVGWIFRIELI
jgi:hypothetical protein